MRLCRFARERFVAMVQDGAKADAIAAAFGMSTRSVYRYCRKLGLARKVRRVMPPPRARAISACELWAVREMPTIAIAAHFGCSVSCVNRAAVRFGIPLRGHVCRTPGAVALAAMLEEHGGDITALAASLGMQRSYVKRRLEEVGAIETMGRELAA